ncbi:hypothetical protein QE152_g26882 [Popillia japonica]|uniref:Uncharacterized protein n=1 Tax=Popillia japonica TaxID=7064 RepID=A0AAW1JY29_POPJA
MTPISFNSIGCPREDTKIINSFSSNRAAQSSIEDVSIDFHESKELLQSIQHYTKQIKVLRARRKKYIKAIRKLKQNVNILENESKTICL